MSATQSAAVDPANGGGARMADSLSGVTVVEVGEMVSAPWCTRLLADLGATVVKIESPGGDPARRWRWAPAASASDETAVAAAVFAHYNAGKHHVTLDLSNDLDAASLAELLAQADVVVTNWDLERRTRAGLDGDSLRLQFPSLIVATASILGSDCEHRATGLDADAVSGVAWAIGSPGRAPLMLPFNQAEQQAGLNLAGAIVLALLGRRQDGLGRNVDVVAADVLAGYAGTNALNLVHYGSAWRRAGKRAYDSGGPYPYVMLPCQDGEVVLIGRSRRDWQALMAAMDFPVWAADPRYQDLIAMGRDYPDEVDDLLVPWLRDRTRSELVKLSHHHGFPLGPVKTVREVIDQPEGMRDGFLRRVGDAVLPSIPFRSTAAGSSASAGSTQVGSPVDAASAAQVLRSARRRVKPSGAVEHARPGGVLDGLRVLDLTWVWSGPAVGAALADFGAEVIKVEHGRRLDNMRLLRRPADTAAAADADPRELGPGWHQLNRSKRSITLNIKDPRGQELVRRLAGHCDVVIENLSVGALDKSGLGYEALREVRPDLIMLSLVSAAPDTSLSGMKGYAPVMSAYAGLESLVGYPGEAPVGMLNVGYGDPNAASFGLLAVLAALRQRDETGLGQYIQLSQIEAVAAMLGVAFADASLGGGDALAGNDDPNYAIHGIFGCAEEDRWFSLSARAESDVAALRAFLDTHARGGATLPDAVRAWAATRPRSECVSALRALGLAASPVQGVEEQWQDKSFVSRQVRQPVTHPLSGPELLYATPWRLDADAGPRVRASAPLLGEGNSDILGKLLGLPAADAPDSIATLTQEGVIS